MATSDLPLYKTIAPVTTNLFQNVTLRGNVSVFNTESYLNVPYAHNPVRWTPPKRYSSAQHYISVFKPSADTLELDCTKYGPRAPQDMSDSTLHWVLAPWFPRLSNMRYHEEEHALQLNIYKPAGVVKDLPVLVYVHGGGFVNGDNSSEFDGTMLVRRSVELGKPIIVVSANYRLNVLGYFLSPELEKEQGFVSPNFGLLDQRAALVWIQQFIGIFGGDKTNVTFSGESAGAMSCMVLAQQPEHNFDDNDAIFKNVISLSAPALKLKSQVEMISLYEYLLANSRYTPEKGSALDYLRTIPFDKIVKMKAKGIGPVAAEPVLFQKGYDQTYTDSKPASWVKGMMLGTAYHETSFFSIGLGGWRDKTAGELYTKWENAVKELPPSVATTIADAYGISKPTDDSETSWSKIAGPLMMIASDTLFDVHNYDRAIDCAGTSTKAYLFQLKQTDPFKSSVMNGWSCHSWTIPFLLCTTSVARKWLKDSVKNMSLTTQDTIDEFFAQHECLCEQDEIELQAGADAMTERVVKFMYGVEPWSEFNAEGHKSFVIDGVRSGEVDDDMRRRRGGRWFAWDRLDEEAKAGILKIVGLIR
ncbi:Alpha/Beta hydrolase protein [Lipomyces arxii]|uniref:Alpha/Beta hydrolase protein n=1 Tax=Lipomyces arxii TaxID=56418 RepID=UPI0034CE1D79